MSGTSITKNNHFLGLPSPSCGLLAIPGSSDPCGPRGPFEPFGACTVWGACVWCVRVHDVGASCIACSMCYVCCVRSVGVWDVGILWIGCIVCVRVLRCSASMFRLCVAWCVRCVYGIPCGMVSFSVQFSILHFLHFLTRAWIFHIQKLHEREWNPGRGDSSILPPPLNHKHQSSPLVHFCRQKLAEEGIEPGTIKSSCVSANQAGKRFFFYRKRNLKNTKSHHWSGTFTREIWRTPKVKRVDFCRCTNTSFSHFYACNTQSFPSVKVIRPGTFSTDKIFLFRGSPFRPPLR